MSACDRHLARVLARHFDPRGGTPYWLERQEQLGFDVRTTIRELSDLVRLGPFCRDDLLSRPLEDFIPRSLREEFPSMVLAETGGTTGRPARCVYSAGELEQAFGEPFARVAEARGFPRRARWLFVGPSGPHVIARAARLFARRQGALEPFSVDFDPRWARAQEPGSLGEVMYRQHVLDQALDILGRESVEVLFTTPPVALDLADALAPVQRARIRGLHLGGMPLDKLDALRLREAFEQAEVVPGYGNALFGLLVEPLRGDRCEDLEYFALGDRLQVRVVAEGPEGPDLVRDIDPGQQGRVMMSRLDESFLLPNWIERDRATRVVADAQLQAQGYGETGLRNPQPVVAAQAARGLY